MPKKTTGSKKTTRTKKATRTKTAARVTGTAPDLDTFAKRYLFSQRNKANTFGPFEFSIASDGTITVNSNEISRMLRRHRVGGTQPVADLPNPQCCIVLPCPLIPRCGPPRATKDPGIYVTIIGEATGTVPGPGGVAGPLANRKRAGEGTVHE